MTFFHFTLLNENKKLYTDTLLANYSEGFESMSHGKI